MKRRLIPKSCTVQSIYLLGDGRAEVRYRCGDEGGERFFPIPGGGISNYRSKIVKANSIRFRGMTVSGGPTRAGFVLSPAKAICHKDGREIACHLVGDKSLPSLQGLPSKRRRKRR